MKTFLRNTMQDGSINLQEITVKEIRDDGIAIVTSSNHFKGMDQAVGVNSKRLIKLNIK